MLHKFVDIITSLKLTIVCLAAGMALIFAGTLAQVHLGIHEAQQRYFQSMFVWWPPGVATNGCVLATSSRTCRGVVRVS